MPTRTPARTAHAARALAHKESQAVLRALASTRKVHDAIHRARKGIRRLRALLQLVEARLPGVAAADVALRRTNDSLSALRDAHAVIAIAERFARGGDGERWLPVIAHLSRRRDALLDKAQARDPGFQRRRSRVERAATLLRDMDWDPLGPADLHRGLERARSRVEKAARRAGRDPAPENLHRWRRRVRRLRMQVEAATRIAPEIAVAMAGVSRKEAKALRGLSDRLGVRQDRAVLRKLLRRMPGVPHRRELLAQLRDGNGGAGT